MLLLLFITTPLSKYKKYLFLNALILNNNTMVIDYRRFGLVRPYCILLYTGCPTTIYPLRYLLRDDDHNRIPLSLFYIKLTWVRIILDIHKYYYYFRKIWRWSYLILSFIFFIFFSFSSYKVDYSENIGVSIFYFHRPTWFLIFFVIYRKLLC